MVVKNRTELSGEKTTEILLKSASRDQRKKYLYVLVIFVIGILSLVIGLIIKEANVITMGAVISAIGVAFVIYVIVDLKMMRKRVEKNNPEIIKTGILYNFTFKENSVSIEAKIGEKNKNLKYSYMYLKGIYEYNDGYEIIFNESDSIYVLKSGFESEKMEEFFRKNITTTKKKIKLVK
ncbi:MAG: hypothetical protein IJM36_02905 [Acholeplasmatales bacterium]|nr:hypothetical protein [Acholeplasmatales bacterium]